MKGQMVLRVHVILFFLTLVTSARGDNMTTDGISDGVTTRSTIFIADSPESDSENTLSTFSYTKLYTFTYNRPLTLTSTKPNTFTYDRPLTLTSTKPNTFTYDRPLTLTSTKPNTFTYDRPLTLTSTKPNTFTYDRPLTLTSTKPNTFTYDRPSSLTSLAVTQSSYRGTSGSSISLLQSDVKTNDTPYYSRNTSIIVSTEDFAACFTKRIQLRFNAESGNISLNYQPSNTTKETLQNGSSLNSIGLCWIEVSLPPEKKMKVMIHRAKSDEMLTKLSVFDRPDYPTFLLSSGDKYPVSGFSYTNLVTFELKGNTSTAFSWSLEFWSVVNTNPSRAFQINYTSPSQGYIQPVECIFCRSNLGCPDNVGDKWIRIPVTSGHSVLISVVKYMYSNEPCALYGLYLYKGRDDGDDRVWHSCDEIIPPAVLLQTSAFFVRLACTRSVRVTSVRLIFSFHSATNLPEQAPDGKWNCSVPHWTDFSRHFLCDLKVQCARGEDELTCPYTMERCGLGFITVYDSCFEYVKTDRSVSWDEAADLCQQRGSSLPALKTWELWRSFVQFLNSGFMWSYAVIGLQTAPQGLPHIYKYAWQWPDSSIAYSANISSYRSRPKCAYLKHGLIKTNLVVYADDCATSHFQAILCQFLPVLNIDEKKESINFEGQAPETNLSMGYTYLNVTKTFVRCPQGHFTQTFFACDVKSLCWAQSHASCNASMTSLPPSFSCENKREWVLYTLVCDYRHDCSDSSDETFCVFQSCYQSALTRCSSSQCVKNELICDGLEHCFDGADERNCIANSDTYGKTISDLSLKSLPPPAVIEFDGRGTYKMKPFVQENPRVGKACPEIHFLCPNTGYCLPVYVRCNGVYDCPGHEDEADCDSRTCRGYYRCRASGVCVHTSHVCDGIFQCPQHDDELLCDLKCPENCTCHGHAFVCTQPFRTREYPDIRYVDAHSTGMALAAFSTNTFLILLNLSHCGLKELDDIILNNLRILDLGFNIINNISSQFLRGFTNLRLLSLAGNPLVSIFNVDSLAPSLFHKLISLDLTQVYIYELNMNVFTLIPDLQNLTLMNSGIVRLQTDCFKPLSKLRLLDLRGCPIADYPRDMFQGLSSLETLYADDYKLCCLALLPAGALNLNCQAPTDELSSCEPLLRSNGYRICLFVFAMLALTGNTGCFFYLVIALKATIPRAHNVFITHLCVSDFLMGVYLVMIGVADWKYRDNYLSEDVTWKNSTACKLSGFLAFVSKEMSLFIVCFLSMDGFLKLHFPGSDLRFFKRSAQVACALTWSLVMTLCTLPFLPLTSHWNLYSQSDVCIPLPITRKAFEGTHYSFGIMIVLNLVLIMLMIFSELFIYWSLFWNSLSVTITTEMEQDLAIAHRLNSIITFNILCWLPIGIVGVMAVNGIAIAGEAVIAIATIVLPLNSALNPFLYWMNMVCWRMQNAREKETRRRALWKLKFDYALGMKNTKVGLSETTNLYTV